MRDRNEIKMSLLTVLNEVVDPFLLSDEFKRRKQSTKYTRKVKDFVHEIDFLYSLFPKYEKEAQIHLHPTFRIKSKEVGVKALELVNNDKFLLANAPDIILMQPIDFFAPKEYHERWFVKKNNDYKNVVLTVCNFYGKWVKEIIDNIPCFADLINISNDKRILKQSHWYVYLIAMYLLNGQQQKAIDVLHSHFSKTGIKKMYNSIYEYFGLS